jgi:hypothetical protein
MNHAETFGVEVGKVLCARACKRAVTTAEFIQCGVSITPEKLKTPHKTLQQRHHDTPT